MVMPPNQNNSKKRENGEAGIDVLRRHFFNFYQAKTIHCILNFPYDFLGNSG